MRATRSNVAWEREDRRGSAVNGTLGQAAEGASLPWRCARCPAVGLAANAPLRPAPACIRRSLASPVARDRPAHGQRRAGGCETHGEAACRCGGSSASAPSIHRCSSLLSLPRLDRLYPPPPLAIPSRPHQLESASTGKHIQRKETPHVHCACAMCHRSAHARFDWPLPPATVRCRPLPHSSPSRTPPSLALGTTLSNANLFLCRPLRPLQCTVHLPPRPREIASYWCAGVVMAAICNLQPRRRRAPSHLPPSLFLQFPCPSIQHLLHRPRVADPTDRCPSRQLAPRYPPPAESSNAPRRSALTRSVQETSPMQRCRLLLLAPYPIGQS